MKDFIRILEHRIRKNTIKKFLPFGEKQLNLYYNTSRQRVELETFKFESKELRDAKILELDTIFGIYEF